MARTSKKAIVIDQVQTASSAEVLIDGAGNQTLTFWETVKMFAEMSGVKIPSMKRGICAVIAAFVVSFASGAVANVLLNVIFAAGLTAGLGAFLTTMIYTVGWVLATYATIKLATAAGLYVASAKLDDDIVRVWNWGKERAIVSRALLTAKADELKARASAIKVAATA